MNTQQQIKATLDKLPHKLQVSFALHCARDCFHLNSKEDKPKIEECLSLVERWLRGENVTQRKLEDAAASAACAIYAAATIDAIYAAAASAACAASYSYSYSYSYSAAASAAASVHAIHAIYASYAIYDAAGAREKKLKEYLSYLRQTIKDMPLVERIILNLDVE